MILHPIFLTLSPLIGINVIIIYYSTCVGEDQVNKSATIKSTAQDGKYSTACITCCNIFESLKVAKTILSVYFTTKLRLCGHLLIVCQCGLRLRNECSNKDD